MRLKYVHNDFLSKRREATLKHNIVFLCDIYPDLLFLISKRTFRNLQNIGLHSNALVLSVPATVYFKKNRDPLALLDLDLHSTLHLIRRSNSYASSYISNQNLKETDDDSQYIEHLIDSRNSSKYSLFNEFISRISDITFSASGRRADIQLQILF